MVIDLYLAHKYRRNMSLDVESDLKPKNKQTNRSNTNVKSVKTINMRSTQPLISKCDCRLYVYGHVHVYTYCYEP